MAVKPKRGNIFGDFSSNWPAKIRLGVVFVGFFMISTSPAVSATKEFDQQLEEDSCALVIDNPRDAETRSNIARFQSDVADTLENLAEIYSHPDAYLALNQMRDVFRDKKGERFEGEDWEIVEEALLDLATSARGRTDACEKIVGEENPVK